MNNKRHEIISYVELFFCEIPYSEKNSMIKSKIIEKLQLELNETENFEKKNLKRKDGNLMGLEFF